MREIKIIGLIQIKEGVNEGLEIAEDIFEEHVEKFDLPDLEENKTIKVQNLQDKYNSLIDTLEITKKPNYYDI